MEQSFKMPLEKGQVDEIVGTVANLMDDTQHLVGIVSQTMPKVGTFLRENWKPIASMATLGLTAYVILRSTGQTETPRRKLHAAH